MSPGTRKDGSGAGRLLALSAVCLLAVALLGLWTFRRFVAEPEGGPALSPSPVPPVAQAAPSAKPELVVTALEGTVERGAAGRWQPVRVGEVVAPEQTLRTAARAHAELSVGGEGARLVLPERSELQVGGLTRASHRFRLTRGRVQVDYAPEGAREVRIESDSGAVAQASGARFWMLASGTVVAVAAERGLVNLSAAGREVQVREGQQAVVVKGGAPQAPTAIPLDVLLSVARTAQRSGACAVVEGRVEPGSELLVDGEPMAVVADGRFRLTLPQRGSAREALLVVKDPRGKTREQRIACLTQAPEDDPTASVRIDWTQ
ncbi:FecR domain-containing protein [Aggregicoccus sp. 17bor-14]|uniref:FecR domain-containing protein n=1 Tax=Myxococcaceae TaxID=31 RepID=UPI00129D05D0|nr:MULTISPECIES: FecR domain-containing protein [Myxococcaceae]MBF5042031.1 FecR domain-containing protein [Simulacricoccus sp. 17bor-14]MRI87810.1 FecR domain-containing protein [Aggregicoccus sp. 17bor-14]